MDSQPMCTARSSGDAGNTRKSFNHHRMVYAQIGGRPCIRSRESSKKTTGLLLRTMEKSASAFEVQRLKFITVRHKEDFSRSHGVLPIASTFGLFPPVLEQVPTQRRKVPGWNKSTKAALAAIPTRGEYLGRDSTVLSVMQTIMALMLFITVVSGVFIHGS
jgi:hypothetical protein